MILDFFVLLKYLILFYLITFYSILSYSTLFCCILFHFFLLFCLKRSSKYSDFFIIEYNFHFCLFGNLGVLRINLATDRVTIRVTVQVFNPLIGRVLLHLHHQPNNPRVNPADNRQVNQLQTQLLDHRRSRPRKFPINFTFCF